MGLLKRRIGKLPPQRAMAYLGDHLAIANTIYGDKMFVDTRDMSLAPHILIDGAWEHRLTEFYRRSLHKGQHVVDVGSNFGWYAVLAGRRIGAAGRLWAFEANPAVAEILKRNILVNGLVERTTLTVAPVWSAVEEMTFTVFEKHMGNSSLIDFDDGHAGVYYDSVSKMTLRSVTLDDIIPAGERVDLMRVDAEGAEPHVLMGAQRLLADNPDAELVLEVMPESGGPARDADNRDLWRLIAESGRQVYTLGRRGGVERVASVDAFLTMPHCDVICSRHAPRGARRGLSALFG